MAILDGLKAAADALRQADKIPQFQAVLDAQAQIAELQVFNHEQQLEIRLLREELERVRADHDSESLGFGLAIFGRRLRSSLKSRIASTPHLISAFISNFKMPASISFKSSNRSSLFSGASA
jgi:hypothetical protein